MNDGLLEVVAVDNLDLAILNIGGTGKSICQVSSNSRNEVEYKNEPISCLNLFIPLVPEGNDYN